MQKHFVKFFVLCAFLMLVASCGSQDEKTVQKSQTGADSKSSSMSAESIKDSAKDTYESGKEVVKETVADIKEKSVATYETGKEVVKEAAADVKQTATNVKDEMVEKTQDVESMLKKDPEMPAIPSFK